MPPANGIREIQAQIPARKGGEHQLPSSQQPGLPELSRLNFPRDFLKAFGFVPKKRNKAQYRNLQLFFIFFSPSAEILLSSQRRGLAAQTLCRQQAARGAAAGFRPPPPQLSGTPKLAATPPKISASPSALPTPLATHTDSGMLLSKRGCVA